MQRFALLLTVGTVSLASMLCSGCGSGDKAIQLQGVGATFPAPLYQRWFSEYNKQHADVEINYQKLGSGAGIEQFTKGLVNFGASDAAMTDEEMAKVKVGVQLLPMTAGSVVLAYNAEGLPQELKLGRDAYAGICLGKITKWNDPAIAKTNEGAKLPDQKITFVRRSDGSGTTYAFTNHLSAISQEWKTGPGVGTNVNWPNTPDGTPTGVAGKGNDGVAAAIKQTPGALGYLEYGYAKQSQLPMATLQNKTGTLVKPTLESGQAALANVELPEDLRAWLPDPDGTDAYPIVTYTWILAYKKYEDPKIAQALKGVLKYGLTDGQKFSADLGYIPLPEKVVAKVTKALDNITP